MPTKLSWPTLVTLLVTGSLVPWLSRHGLILTDGQVTWMTGALLVAPAAIIHLIHATWDHLKDLTSSKVAAFLLPALLASTLIAGTSQLTGCALTPTQASQLNTLAAAAVQVNVLRAGNDPAQWTARAKKIKAIALELQTVNSAVAQSLPAVLAALTPIIAAAGLSPIDLAIANALVMDLQTLTNNQLGPNPTVNQVQTTVEGVLSAIIAACGAYGA